MLKFGRGKELERDVKELKMEFAVMHNRMNKLIATCKELTGTVAKIVGDEELVHKAIVDKDGLYNYQEFKKHLKNRKTGGEIDGFD